MAARQPRTQLDGLTAAVLVVLLLVFCWLLGSTAGRWLADTHSSSAPTTVHVSGADDHFGTARVGMFPSRR